MCMCLHKFMYTTCMKCARRPKGIKSPRTELQAICSLLDAGAENRNRGPCKSNECFQTNKQTNSPMYFCALYASLVPTENRIECMILWYCSSRWFGATVWVLGWKPGPLEEQLLLLTTEPSFHPIPLFKKLLFYFINVCVYMPWYKCDNQDNKG